jgi:two-component system C4-dicarboxylate transport response regulator DctD
MPDYGPILFVDDEAAMRHAVTQWLGLAGFETIVHDRALTALDKLSTEFHGILVTDLTEWSCCGARNGSIPSFRWW